MGIVCSGCAVSVESSKPAANPNGALGEGTQAAPSQQERLPKPETEAKPDLMPTTAADPKRPPSPQPLEAEETAPPAAPEPKPVKADDTCDQRTPKGHVPIPLNDQDAQADGDQKGAGRLRFAAVELVEPAAPFRPKAEPSKSLLKTSSYIGSSLLHLAKKHPCLAPLAYSLGATVCNAVSARSLRLDSARLALVLKQAEMALVKLGDQVSTQEAALHQLQQVLDDTMKVVLVLKKRHPQGVVSEEVQEIARGAVLGKLRDRLKDAIQALDQAHSDINKDVLESLDQTSFKESKAVEADAQAAAADVDGQEAVSEQVAAAAADQALDVEAVKLILSTPQEQPLAEFEDPGPLTADPGPEHAQAVIMHKQIKTMQALAEAQGLMPGAIAKQYPLTSMEAERIAYIKQNRLEEVGKEVEVTDLLSAIRVAFKAGYVTASVIGLDTNNLLEAQIDGAALGREPGTVIIHHEVGFARKFSVCQHTIASDQPFLRDLTGGIPACFDMSLFENEGVKQVDEGVAKQAAGIETPGSDEFMDHFMTLYKGGVQSTEQGNPIHYLGVPIKLDGFNIGTVCLLHPPEGWSQEGQDLVIQAAETVASRIRDALKKRGG